MYDRQAMLEKNVARLAEPSGRLRVVIDTDTYNEIDDQFALAYALASGDRLAVEALYAAPFYNHLSSGPEDGMLKSYDEILRVLSLFGRPAGDMVFKGSTGYLESPQTPRESAAAHDLVQRAMAPGEPLCVVAIGAITNVASAILMEPEIADRIVVVWLGGHALHWPHTREFNLEQDIWAARTLFDSGVPLVLVPCHGVASHLSTTLSEIRDHLKGVNPIGDYLHETYRNCSEDHFAYSRVIWDISTIAYLMDPSWVRTELVHSPVLTDQVTWSFDSSRHFIRLAREVNRDAIFRDLFLKIRSMHG